MIKFFSLFCLASVLVLVKPSPIEPHVVGGSPAREGDFPWLVALKIAKNRQFFCGGALISKRYILTAAHCIDSVPPEAIVVGVGSVILKHQKTYKLDKIIPHPEFNHSAISNDIALLRLKEDMEFTEDVQPLEFKYTENFDLKNVTAVGWGKTSLVGHTSEHLMFLNGWILPLAKCRKQMKYTGYPIYDHNICFESRKYHGMCFGDSGSPLIYKENNKVYAAGVVSWGIPCAIGYPDVFTKANYFTSWVEENMEE